MGLRNCAADISRNGKTIVITSLIMLFIVIAVSVLVFFASLRGGDQVIVPNVIGKEFVSASIDMQAKELYPKVQLRYTSDQNQAGIILEQDPAPGSIVKGGRRVTVVVGQGTVAETLENYIGKSVDEVRERVQFSSPEGKTQYIRIKQPILYQYSTKPAGTILAQNPQAGTSVTGNVTVELVVSKGNKRTTATVPDIVGKSLPELYKILSKSSAVFEFFQGDAIPKDHAEVTAQMPKAGTKLPAREVAQAKIGFPLDSSENTVYGIIDIMLPKYPYPFTLTLDASYTNGRRVELVSFRHPGGRCTIPYGLPKGTVLILSAGDDEVYSTEL